MLSEISPPSVLLGVFSQLLGTRELKFRVPSSHQAFHPWSRTPHSNSLRWVGGLCLLRVRMSYEEAMALGQAHGGFSPFWLVLSCLSHPQRELKDKIFVLSEVATLWLCRWEKSLDPGRSLNRNHQEIIFQTITDLIAIHWRELEIITGHHI